MAGRVCPAAQFAGAAAFLARETQQTGTGPGVCIIWTQTTESQPAGLLLPGRKAPAPTRTVIPQATACLSDAAQMGYLGAIGNPGTPAGSRLALVPDGVSTVAYTLANQDVISVPVHSNIAIAPAVLTPFESATDVSRYRAALLSHLPTTVTESGPAQTLVRTLARPTTLIPDAIAQLRFLQHQLGTGGGSGSSGGTSVLGVSCSARTHRCVAVTMITACVKSDPCQMTRMIHRYRYVGAKPPRGTTGRQPIDLTAPIVAHTNRRIVSPGKLELVLSGTPHRSVTVVQSTIVFSRGELDQRERQPPAAREGPLALTDLPRLESGRGSASATSARS